MKRFLLLLIFAFGLGYLGWGQILTFEFSALGGGEASAASNFNDANLSSSTITRGAGLTASANAQRFNATNWALTSIANAVSGDDYMEFTITPNSGYHFSVSSIVVQWQRSSTGNSAISLRSSVDSYATDLDAVKTVVDNTTTQTFTWTFTQANSLSAVTYRLYSYAESLTGSGGPGDGTGNDIVVNGTVTSAGNIAPTVTTQAVSSVLTTTATGNGNITATGGINPTVRGFCWDLASNADPDISDSKVEETGDFTTGAFTGSITGLTAGTQYKVRAFATNTVNTGYGSVVTFYTQSTEPTNHPASFTASAVSQTQIDLAFSAASTIPASGYLILQKTGSATIGSPSDANAYIVGNTIGDGTVAAIITNTADISKSITGLTAGTHYYFSIFPYNWDGVDASTYNYKTDGSVPVADANTASALDATSEVSGPVIGSQPNPILISSLATTDVSAIRAFDMDVYDYGSDGQPTKITQLTIKAGTNNTANWANSLAGVKLSTDAGATFVTLGTPTIAASSIVIPVISGNLNIPDNDALTISLYVYLKNSGLTDNQILEFKVDQTVDSHGFIADATGSTFIPTFATAPISNQIIIDVVATKLRYVQQPSNTNLNATMTPAVTIETTDANNNRDLDKTGTVSLVSSGTMTGTVDATLTAGFGTFGNIVHTSLGTGLTITASLGSLTDAVSNTFNIFTIAKIFISEYLEGSSNNKAVEIYNGEASAIDLTKLSLRLYANGSPTPGNTWIGTSGTLGAGKTIIIYNSGATLPDILAYGFEASTVTFYNGDDALDVLYDGQVTDVFGTIGTDPGTAWSVAGQANATVNFTLIRKTSITEGTTNWATSAGTTAENSQWVVKAIDNSANLGAFGTAWIGTTDTDWATATNWDMGVPASTTNTIITNVTNDPIISGSISLPNLLIKSGGALTLTNSGQLTVNGTLTNNAGLTGLVIKSDAGGTGSLIHNTDNINATVERYLTGNTTLNGSYDFHQVSVPLNADGTAAIFNGMYLYKFDQTVQDYVSMGNDPATVLDNNTGYMIFYPNTSTTASMTGQLNNGTFTALTATDAADEFSLVPNPYPSAINWDAASGWTKSNLQDAFYIWDPISNNYVTWSGGAGTALTSNIPVGQSFFVKANAASPVLTMTNAVRAHSTQAFWKNTESIVPEIFRLKVSDNESADEMIVRFNNEAAADRGFLDVDKLYGADIAPQLYSVTQNDDKLTINALDHSTQTIVVPVGIEYPESKSLTFTASGIESFESSVNIFLEDKLLNKTIDLRENPVYTFTNATGADPLRFNLLFYGVNSTNELSNANYNIWVNNDKINILVPELIGQKAIVQLIDQQGRIINTSSVNLDSPSVINAPVSSGLYIVRVVSGNQAFTSKVFIR
jgi:hypothetical protein